MACFAPPYGLRYAAHCFNRAHAQQHCPALIPAGGKLGVTSAGSEEKSAVFQELLDNGVQMFVSVLKPHSASSPTALERRCVGLVGAGEALSSLMVRGHCSEAEALEAFVSLINGGSQGPLR